MSVHDAGRKLRAERIGANVKKIRLQRKLTRTQVMRLCGWTQQQKLWRIETGRCVPASDTLLDLSRVLEVSVDTLLREPRARRVRNAAA